uniref:60S ribosomal protein L7 n=4 Tax=Culex pipiens TaxID=7175 RepID=A0A8D8NQ72_CULPI
MPAAAKTAPAAKAPADKKAKVAKKEKKLPAVPESKLKATKAKVIARPGSLRRRRQLQAVKLLRRRQNLLRAAKYTKKYARMEREVVEKAREAKKAGNIYIPAEPKVAFVMRIRG